ncbi:S8 family serine peptidase [Streptomyces sp. SCUT-3]|uniref:S8 family serine peptidase n=1 Tax=Streptomyces sp. SCUT-3 TaxID=2684469 RepID=UPI0015FBBAA7|nr:S8 family serine peptidase [Streptomyces sp. SCUT-3]
MNLLRTVRIVSSATLSGALLLASTAPASADRVRQDQWALDHFQAEKVWEISQGEGVTVAVIDIGFEVNHQDISQSLLEGKDFVDGGSVDPEQGESHGTGMASIIAAHGHGLGGGDGVRGLAPKAKILPVRIKASGNLADPIIYAVDQGASVINISLGGSGKTQEEEEAVAYALKKDVLVINASGNDGEPGLIGYPGKYPGVLTIGAVGERGEIWEDSNYGPEVLLTAPGVGIVSAGGNSPGAYYHKGNGTSSSAAYTSAAAALVRAEYPDLTAGQVVNRLVKTAGLPESTKGLSLPDEKYGYGYIRPLAALTENIPAGSKYGPLKVPDSLDSSSPEAEAEVEAGSGSGTDSSNTLKRILVFVVAPVFLLLVVGVTVFAVVRSSRRKKRSAPVGVGWGEGPQAQQPPYGQPMPPGNAGGFPPQPQGPNQNQPSGPWGP